MIGKELKRQNKKFMNKKNIIYFILGTIVITVLLVRNFSSVQEYASDVSNTEYQAEEYIQPEKEQELPVDPIEFAKKLQMEIENKYPGGVNGLHSWEQYDTAREDILSAYSKKDCLLKLGNVCFKPLFKITEADGMLYRDCLNFGGEYGIKYCYAANDAYAGLAQKCGGTQNLPTKQEIMMLADYLYGIKAEDCTNLHGYQYSECESKYEKGLQIKKDNDLVQEYFLYKHPFLALSGEDYQNQLNSEHFIIGSGEERSGHFVYGWNFSANGVKYNPDMARSFFFDNLGICVSRD